MALVLQVFVFRDGAFLGTEMAVGERVEIGRDPDCVVRLDDDACSRRHALIFESDGRLAIQDLGSANGTLLNGERLTSPRYLTARDDVAIGRHTLKFKSMNAVGASGPNEAAPGFAAQPATQMVSDATPAPAQPSPVQPPPVPAPSGPMAAAPGISAPMAAAPGVSGPRPVAPGISGPAPLAPGVSGPGPVAPGVSGPAAAALGYASPQATPAPIEALLSGEGAPSSSGPMRAAPGLPPQGYDAPLVTEPVPQSGVGRAPGATYPIIEHAESTDRVPGRGSTRPEQERAPLVESARALLADGDAGQAAPPVAWTPGAWVDDDDDDDDDFVPSWSLVQRLVRAPAGEDKVKDSVVEVLHYRGEAVVDHAVLVEGDTFSFGRTLGREGLDVRGLRRPQKMLTHRKDNVVELRLEDNVSGRLLRQGQQIDVRSLPEAQGGKGKLPLTAGDMASIDIGGDRVFVRFAKRPEVKPPPELLQQMKEERRLLWTSLGSALGVFLLMGAVGWIWQYRAHSQQVIQLEDDGFAEVIEKVELELEEPEPEPPKVEEPPPPEPEKTPPPEMKQPKVANHTPAKPTKDPPKPKAISALDKIPKLNDKASSQNLNAAMSNIKGVRVPGASGFKVSALIGKGPSSGVQIGGSAGGLETSGLNSVIRKTGGVGGLTGKKDRRIKGRVAALKQRSKVKGQGQLSRDEIQKVINQHISEIQYCYEKQLRSTPNLHGKVVLEWTIKPDGRVGVVKSGQTTLQSAAAVNCMIGKVKSWRFPQPRGNGSVIVTYPFIFNTL